MGAQHRIHLDGLFLKAVRLEDVDGGAAQRHDLLEEQVEGDPLNQPREDKHA